jgi:hypothetical protein
MNTMNQYLRGALRKLAYGVLYAGLSALFTACGGSGGNAASSIGVPLVASGLTSGASVTIEVTAAGNSLRKVIGSNGTSEVDVPVGATYEVAVVANPPGQGCSVRNAKGVATASGNATVEVACGSVGFKIGGVAEGITSGGSTVLVLRVAESSAEIEVGLLANGPFEFPQAVSGSFVVTVKSTSADLSCEVLNGVGTAAADVANIGIRCAAAGVRISGTAEGLFRPIQLRNTATNEILDVSSNGLFSFVQLVPRGSQFSVVVAGPDAAAQQQCLVESGAAQATADVTNVRVFCTALLPPSPAPVPPGPVVPPPPSPPAPTPVPAVPANFSVSYDVKAFRLSWTESPTATTYQLFEDPDGPGPLGPSQVGSALAGTSATVAISGLLHSKVNAAYIVKACNTSGCGSETVAITPDLAQAVAYIKASNTGSSDRFGASVALSADGLTLAVGAPGESSAATGINGDQSDNSALSAGAVYVFTRSGSAWVQQDYIKASNTGVGDAFGTDVSLSRRGDTLAVSAVGEDSSARGIGGDQTSNDAVDSGAVYIFQRTGSTWSQEAYIKASNAEAGDKFGNSLQISDGGDILIVGAPEEDSNGVGAGRNPGDNSAVNAGAAYVYVRTTPAWVESRYLKASNAEAQDRFGIRVAIAGLGATFAVSALGESSSAVFVDGSQTDNTAASSGAVYIFDGTLQQVAYIKASNTEAADQFGLSLSLSQTGNVLAVGAGGEDSGSVTSQTDNSSPGAGAVYIYRNTLGFWAFEAYLKATEVANTATSKGFGADLKLSEQGDVLAIGALNENSAGTGIGLPSTGSSSLSGATYIMRRVAGVWGASVLTKASNTAALDRFGSSLSLSGDGTQLVVGAPNEDSGATGINGNQSDNSRDSSGAVYAY